jgi:hypothetical protein
MAWSCGRVRWEADVFFTLEGQYCVSHRVAIAMLVNKSHCECVRERQDGGQDSSTQSVSQSVLD